MESKEITDAAAHIWKQGCVGRLTGGVKKVSAVTDALQAMLGGNLRVTYMEQQDHFWLCVYTVGTDFLAEQATAEQICNRIKDIVERNSVESNRALLRLSKALTDGVTVSKLEFDCTRIHGDPGPTPATQSKTSSRRAKVARIIAFNPESLQLTLMFEDGVQERVSVSLGDHGDEYIVQHADIVQTMERLASPLKFELPLRAAPSGLGLDISGRALIDAVNDGINCERERFRREMESLGASEQDQQRLIDQFFRYGNDRIHRETPPASGLFSDPSPN